MSTTGRSPACRRSPRGSFWKSSSPVPGGGASPRIQPFPLHPDIHLALDIAPFLGGAQRADQLLEGVRIGGRVFEPGQGVGRAPRAAGGEKVAGRPPAVFFGRPQGGGFCPQKPPPPPPR